MSSSNAAGEAEEVQSDVCCANCGVAEIDDIKLKDCDGCDLVKYCSDNCREEHQEQHEEECKKRKAKLHDDDLFEQPGSSHLGECPICFLPMPLLPQKVGFHSCCGKLLCDGCDKTMPFGETCYSIREQDLDMCEACYDDTKAKEVFASPPHWPRMLIAPLWNFYILQDF